MSLQELGIEHKKLKETLVAAVRFNLKERKEMHTVLEKLTQEIPEETIVGPAFCIFQFVTSVKEGFEVAVRHPQLE